MSRVLSNWPLLAACIALAGPARAAAPGPNLLHNPGFEELRGGVTAAWDTTDSGLPTVFFGRDSVEHHSGDVSVYVANVSTVIPMWHNFSQTLLIQPDTWGKDLTFSVWTKSNGLQGRAYILLQCYKDTLSYMAKNLDIPRDEVRMRLNVPRLSDPQLPLDWERLYFLDENTDWVKREVRAYVPQRTNVVFVRVGIFGTGQVFFDDASLTVEAARPAPAIPTGVNLLRDPGFEGDCTTWEYSMPPYEGIRIDRDSSLAHGGRASMRYSEGRSGMIKARTGVCQTINNRNLGGKRFRMSGWCKTDSLRGTAFMAAYSHMPDTAKVLAVTCRQSMTQDWTRCTEEFETPPGTVLLWIWAAYEVPVSGTVWFDDLSLEYLGPAKGATKARPAKPAPRSGAQRK